MQATAIQPTDSKPQALPKVRPTAGPFLAREARNLVLAGVVVWLLATALAGWGARQIGLASEDLAISLQGLSLVIGFILASVAVLLYGTMRALLQPRSVAAMAGAGAIFFSPVLVGLALGLAGVDLESILDPLLYAAPALLVLYCLGAWLVEADRRTGAVRRRLAAVGKTLRQAASPLVQRSRGGGRSVR